MYEPGCAFLFSSRTNLYGRRCYLLKQTTVLPNNYTNNCSEQDMQSRWDMPQTIIQRG